VTSVPEMIPGSGLSSTGLAPLPHPVYFVHPYRSRWDDIFDGTELPDPDLIYWRFSESNDIWVVQTYLHLRNRGLDVRLASRLVPDAINVIMNYDLGIREFSYHSYVVSCRADTFRPTICHQTIVQNAHNVSSPTEHLVHHWPQPGLLPREVSRGSSVESVVYKGNSLNLWQAFRNPSFQSGLEEIGVTFKIHDQTTDFHDFRECDVVLAVRDLTATDYLSKPATKLINAWLSGAPALLGPEPAFQALRKTPLDYIEISSPEEAIGAVRRLKQDPVLYREMVENGRVRAQDFTPDRVVARWHEVLAGPVAEGYSAWVGRSVLWKSLGRRAQFALQATRNIYERRKYIKQRDHGFRPMSGRYT
jgi:hypothetical protein